MASAPPPRPPSDEAPAPSPTIVSCLTSSPGHTAAILESLKGIGVRSADVTVVDPHLTDATSRTPDQTPEGLAEGAAAGAAGGGIFGLFIGIGGLLLPGAAIGAAAGGLAGALVGRGVPEAIANGYEERLRAGRSLILVRAAEQAQAQRIMRIFIDAEAEEITQRS